MYKHPDKKVSEVLSYFVGKCRKNERTIERYIRKAKEYNTSRIQKQERVRDDVLIDMAKVSIKKAISTRNEGLEILTAIARSSKRDDSRIRAVTVLADIQGWNERKKIDVTTNGGDLKTVIKFRYEDFNT